MTGEGAQSPSLGSASLLPTLSSAPSPAPSILPPDPILSLMEGMRHDPRLAPNADKAPCGISNQGPRNSCVTCVMHTRKNGFPEYNVPADSISVGEKGTPLQRSQGSGTGTGEEQAGHLQGRRAPTRAPSTEAPTCLARGLREWQRGEVRGP